MTASSRLLLILFSNLLLTFLSFPFLFSFVYLSFLFTFPFCFLSLPFCFPFLFLSFPFLLLFLYLSFLFFPLISFLLDLQSLFNLFPTSPNCLKEFCKLISNELKHVSSLNLSKKRYQFMSNKLKQV